MLDKKLLLATDQATKRTKQNRPALVRDVLREHLRPRELRMTEARDRQGYTRYPQSDADHEAWESEAEWPAE